MGIGRVRAPIPSPRIDPGTRWRIGKPGAGDGGCYLREEGTARLGRDYIVGDRLQSGRAALAAVVVRVHFGWSRRRLSIRLPSRRGRWISRPRGLCAEQRNENRRASDTACVASFSRLATYVYLVALFPCTRCCRLRMISHTNTQIGTETRAFRNNKWSPVAFSFENFETDIWKFHKA
jgi:hypothetical protein